MKSFLHFSVGANPLFQNVAEGREMFFEKYGQYPTACYLHPHWLPVEIEGIEVRGSNTLLPHHIWFVLDKSAKS